MDYQRLLLTGRMGTIPTQIRDDYSLHSFRLASHRWSKKTKSMITDWYTVKIWNDSVNSEKLSSYQIGDRIFVEGQMQIQNYTDSEGQEKKSFDVIAQRIYKLHSPMKKKEMEEPEDGNEESELALPH